jgi:hypothetical protein
VPPLAAELTIAGEEPAYVPLMPGAFTGEVSATGERFVEVDVDSSDISLVLFSLDLSVSLHKIGRGRFLFFF